MCSISSGIEEPNQKGEFKNIVGGKEEQEYADKSIEGSKKAKDNPVCKPFFA